MAGSNNFQQFDEDLTNLMGQSDYEDDTQRKGGFTKGKSSSNLVNKIFYQMSSMVSALGEALKNKGYTMDDGSSGNPSWDDLVAELGNLITAADMEDYYTITEVEAYVNAAVSNAAAPVGSVYSLTFAASNAQLSTMKCLECNGQAVSRTTFVNLFAAIGTSYGTGDGSTTFNLPDYRGEFLRGWNHGKASSPNDPDAAARTNRGDGVGGDYVGTKQEDQLASHIHTYTTKSRTLPQTGSDTPCWWGTKSADTGSTGGNETRPKNIYVMYVIKY